MILSRATAFGLLRTGILLFIGRQRLPTEDDQHAAMFASRDAPRRHAVVIRTTLDVGGDKPLPGSIIAALDESVSGPPRPSGCARKPALFRPQVRALLRAGAIERCRLMLADDRDGDELTVDAASSLPACLAELRSQGRAAELPPLGIMVRTRRRPSHRVLDRRLLFDRPSTT